MGHITQILFLGISGCFPEAGGDTASFCLGNELLIDTGWYSNQRLRAAGILPQSIRHILLTHEHHDHTLGLPALIFENYMAKTIAGLKIYGPEESAERLVNDALRFIRSDFFWPEAGSPMVIKLSQKDSFDTPNFEISAAAPEHAVPARCYTIRDKRNNIQIGFSGDCIYRKELPEFFSGCDILIHEFSHGLQTPADNVTKHSSIQNAARCAEEAGVKILCPVHGPSGKKEIFEACKNEASKIFHGTVHWPRAGEIFSIQ